MGGGADRGCPLSPAWPTSCAWPALCAALCRMPGNTGHEYCFQTSCCHVRRMLTSAECTRTKFKAVQCLTFLQHSLVDIL
eukprot:366337-Chlamydomonas_euryale.AAC.11